MQISFDLFHFIADPEQLMKLNHIIGNWCKRGIQPLKNPFQKQMELRAQSQKETTGRLNRRTQDNLHLIPRALTIWVLS